MRFVKRAFCVLVVIFVIMACIPMSAFATGDVVQFTEAAKLGASIIDLYGMANNTSLAYDIASNQSALTVIENLYTEYSSNASDPYTLAAIGAAAAAAGAIAVIYDAVTGQGYIQLYQEQYISSLDGYWDYQLADAGLVRDSLTGLFNWSLNQQDTVTPIVVYLDNPFANQPISTSSAYPDTVGVASNNQPVTVYGDRNNYYVAVCYYSNYSQYYATAATALPDGGSIRFKFGNTPVNRSSWAFNSAYNLYWDNTMFYPISSIDTTMPSFNSLDDFLTALSDLLNGGSSPSVSIEPSIITGDPLTQPLEITIPDNTSPDYIPVPRRITTTMPVPEGVEIPLPEGVDTPEYGVPYPVTDPATLNAIVPELWDDLVADDVGLRDAPDPEPAPDPAPNPSEVFVPLLPVTLPSFNFNFAGIWHYVRDWVSSLGAWFTMVFTVWSNLPYAIVVPVYATAVIVVVLGVYKRFFM